MGAFQHTTMSAIDNGRLMFLTCNILGTSNQKYTLRQSQPLQVDLTPPSPQDNYPLHSDRFSVASNKKSPHQTKVVAVLKATNNLVFSIDEGGKIAVQSEERKALSVGFVELRYKRYEFN